MGTIVAYHRKGFLGGWLSRQLKMRKKMKKNERKNPGKYRKMRKCSFVRVPRIKRLAMVWEAKFMYNFFFNQHWSSTTCTLQLNQNSIEFQAFYQFFVWLKFSRKLAWSPIRKSTGFTIKKIINLTSKLQGWNNVLYISPLKCFQGSQGVWWGGGGGVRAPVVTKGVPKREREKGLEEEDKE